MAGYATINKHDSRDGELRRSRVRDGEPVGGAGAAGALLRRDAEAVLDAAQHVARVEAERRPGRRVEDAGARPERPGVRFRRRQRRRRIWGRRAKA